MRYLCLSVSCVLFTFFLWVSISKYVKIIKLEVSRENISIHISLWMTGRVISGSHCYHSMLADLTINEGGENVYIRKWSMTVMTCEKQNALFNLQNKEQFLVLYFRLNCQGPYDLQIWFSSSEKSSNQECSFSFSIILLGLQIKCSSNLSSN